MKNTEFISDQRIGQLNPVARLVDMPGVEQRLARPFGEARQELQRQPTLLPRTVEHAITQSAVVDLILHRAQEFRRQGRLGISRYPSLTNLNRESRAGRKADQ